ncbi:hypothetical protein G9G54_13670 [Paenibacillus sp. EKM212P]|uniref:hypothetical protein n=1 Tax=Paenibacillus sp. EKM212P TaxID=1683680 RepID=UPI0013E9F03F|nr:hypothetical protein [Paenibacillus sp. EKM212P]KAF6578320.1 hypothetical protein G9G54_13670 [Paenibacillus sp. EKM212P]
MTLELAMTPSQYNEMMKEIARAHRFGGLSKAIWDDEEARSRCKYIKYVRPNWDMRDGRCFSIRFDPCGKEFHSGYGETVPLYDQIVEWLNSPRENTP